MANEKYMEEWTGICEAYCKKAGAELLFVNTDNFGVQYADGTFHHIYAEELAQKLSAENSGNPPMKENEKMEINRWKAGDTCFVITNGKKRQATEYKVLSYDGRYYFLESRTGSHINASPSRMFRSKEEAAALFGQRGCHTKREPDG